MSYTIQDMMKNGVHFGHRSRFWNPKMAPYIFGVQEKVHIVDLDQTNELLKEALRFIKKLAQNKGKLLFVGTKRACQEVLKEQAQRCGMPYINKRWLGGTMTNYKTIRQSIKRLEDLEKLLNSEVAKNLIKKERLQLQRKVAKLEDSIGGIRNMGGLPDALFVIDVKNERIAIKEANRLRVPVIAIVDTNCDPDGVDYVIPGNDDAIKAIRFYTNCVADAVLEGKQKMDENAACSIEPKAGDAADSEEAAES